MLTLWRGAMTGEKHKHADTDNVSITPKHGNTRAYTLDRLHVLTFKGFSGFETSVFADADRHTAPMTPTLATRPVSILAPGTAFSRFAISLIAAKSDPGLNVVDFAGRWPSTPHVAAALEWRTKAAVVAGTTTNPNWAGALARSGISGEVLPLLQPLSAFEQARSRMREVGFEIPAPRQTDVGTAGYWTQEGAPVPAISFLFDLVTLDALKVAALAVVSQELQRYSDPVGEALLRNALLTALANRLDTTFLDPTATGGSGAPASITSDGTEITSSGATAAALQADLGDMLAAIETSGVGLTWFASPGVLAQIGLLLGAGAGSVPRSLFGIPVIVNANVGDQIVLADLAAVAYAAGDVELDLGEQAAVEMLDNPTNHSVTPTATTLVSLWQVNCVALKVLRFANWAVTADGATAWMSVTPPAARDTRSPKATDARRKG